MAINSSRKRKVTLNNQKYFWFILDKWGQTEFDGIQLRIIPSNQSFYLSYGIGQAEEKRFLSLRFQKNGTHLRLYCPKFENENDIVTNLNIKHIILWCRNTIENKTYQIVPNLYSTSKDLQSDERCNTFLEELLLTIR